MRPTRNRRDDVIHAATRLFSRHGYHATSMQDLGDALGMQRGSLYAHISGKEEVLFDIVQDGAVQFLEALRPIARATHLSAGERLRAAYRAHVRIVASQREAATVFFHEWRFLSEGPRQAIVAMRNEYEELWRQIVRDGVARGEFAAVDEKLAAIWLLSPANWLYQWYNPQGSANPDHIAELFANLALRGLRTGSQPGEEVSVE